MNLESHEPEAPGRASSTSELHVKRITQHPIEEKLVEEVTLG